MGVGVILVLVGLSVRRLISFPMNWCFLFCFVFIFSSTVFSEEKGVLIFEDDFERSEGDDTKEELGREWSTNSAKRAGGHKQADLKDGVLHVKFHPAADHAVSVVHPVEFEDGRVTLRFQLPTKDDSLGLNFADLDFKEVHAGHLCMAKVTTRYVQLNDLKTGVMAKAIRKARKSNSLSEEEGEILKTKVKRVPAEVDAGKWHSLELTIQGETMVLKVNKKKVGEFSSPGIAHPTKRALRIAVPGEVLVDDLKVYSLDK